MNRSPPRMSSAVSCDIPPSLPTGRCKAETTVEYALLPYHEYGTDPRLRFAPKDLQFTRISRGFLQQDTELVELNER